MLRKEDGGGSLLRDGVGKGSLTVPSGVLESAGNAAWSGERAEGEWEVFLILPEF